MFKGRMQELKEKTDHYQMENTDFIILHAGLSRFRHLRCFLINSNFDGAFIYDIIVPKPSKESTINNEEAKSTYINSVSNNEFSKNPFFYSNVVDLLTDLNFKHYLKTEFNAVFTTLIVMIKSFDELNNDIEELYIADYKEEIDKLNIRKIIKQIETDKQYPSVFYTTYKNILEINSTLLKLDNFVETNEFFEGLDFSITQKGKVTPLCNKRIQNDVEITVPGTKKIVFVKSLNKLPLRKCSPGAVFANPQDIRALPLLPQRYVIDKKKYKVFSLRHVVCKRL